MNPDATPTKAQARLTVVPSWVRVGLIAIALAALTLRVAPLLFSASGIRNVPIGYDEGVYFSASALLFHGVLPYRDFVHVHPPGLLYLVGVTSVFTGPLDPADALAAYRLLAAALGAVTVLIVARTAFLYLGPVGCLVSALLYAVCPEVVGADRGPTLEPILNLACLGMALAWFGSFNSEQSFRRTVIAGALGGLALATKLWGAFWLLAAVVSMPRSRPWSHAWRFVVACAVATLALILPLAVVHPKDFISQVLWFQMLRPHDMYGRVGRLRVMFGGYNVIISSLALFGLVAGFIQWRERQRREFRFFATAYVVTLVAFLAPNFYSRHFNSHLAASSCILAGLGASRIWTAIHSVLPSRVRAFALALMLVSLAAPFARTSILDARSISATSVDIASSIRQTVPVEECFFAFEPQWSIAGGRLPMADLTGPVVVDSYATMLLDAMATGQRFADADAAFQHPASQARVRARLETCRFVMLGYGGKRELSAESKAWFRRRFTRQHSIDNINGLYISEQVPRGKTE